MNKQNSGKNNWVGVIIIVLVMVIAFLFVSRKVDFDFADMAGMNSSVSIRQSTLFTQGLAAVGIEADQIGFHGFSPDGRYFLFNAFKDDTPIGNQGYLLRLSDQNIISLPGMPERGIDDNRLLQLYTPTGTTLYWLATGASQTYVLGENVYFGSLSPDGKTYIANTPEGIRKIDIDSGVVTSFTENQYDGAYAWYADSNRVLGFKETGENLFEAGRGRTLGVWDMTTGDFTPMTTSITDKNIRMVAWITPQKIARINTGWDDGSHDYLLDVETGAVIDLGDTSGALMGGVKTDPARGYFALVGGDDQSPVGSRAIFYEGVEKEHDLELAKGYFRQNVHIVDDDTLLYLRYQYSDRGTTAAALIKLDLETGEETVLQELPTEGYSSLSYTPTSRTWVLSTGKLFMTGSL